MWYSFQFLSFLRGFHVYQADLECLTSYLQLPRGITGMHHPHPVFSLGIESRISCTISKLRYLYLSAF